MAIPRRERIATRVFFGLLAVVYVALFPYFRFLNNPNEHTRTFLTLSLVEEGTFAITSQIRRYGGTNDLAARTLPSGATEYYGVKAPAVSYMGVPVYAAFRTISAWLGRPRIEDVTLREERELYLEHVTHLLRVFCVQIPCLLFLVFFERFLRTRTRDLALRLGAVAGVALGTNFFAYALSFTSHALFACAAFTSFAITTLERERGVRARRVSRAFLAGLSAAFCTLLEYHGAGVTLVLGIYAALTFRRPLGVLACAAAASLCAAGMLVYQWKSFGDPLTPGHKLQVNPAFAAHHAEGVNGVSLPDLDVLGSLAFDPGFGLFGSSPYLLLGLLAIPFGLFFLPDRIKHRGRERLTHFVWLFALAGLFLLVSGIHNWHGGWSIGPRYLGAAPPFFAFGAVCAAECFAGASSARRTVARAVSLGLATASVVSMGAVCVLVNTLPEEISRPFPQFAVPMLRAGFVPHHVLELVGVSSGVPVYLVAGLGLLALAIPLVHAVRSRPFATLSIAGASLCAGLALPLSVPDDLDRSAVEQAVAMYARSWNPRGRDFIAQRARALERSPDDPCGWHALADLQAGVGLVSDAARSRLRAGVPERDCDR